MSVATNPFWDVARLLISTGPHLRLRRSLPPQQHQARRGRVQQFPNLFHTLHTRRSRPYLCPYRRGRRRHIRGTFRSALLIPPKGLNEGNGSLQILGESRYLDRLGSINLTAGAGICNTLFPDANHWTNCQIWLTRYQKTALRSRQFFGSLKKEPMNGINCSEARCFPHL